MSIFQEASSIGIQLREIFFVFFSRGLAQVSLSCYLSISTSNELHKFIISSCGIHFWNLDILQIIIVLQLFSTFYHYLCLWQEYLIIIKILYGISTVGLLKLFFQGNSNYYYYQPYHMDFFSYYGIIIIAFQFIYSRIELLYG